MSVCKDCNGWGTSGVAPNAVFCSCWDGRNTMLHPDLGQRWLDFVNSCGKHPMVKLQQSTAVRPDNSWPSARNPVQPQVEVPVADIPPLWDQSEEGV
jgi:hypothetical protein